MNSEWGSSPWYNKEALIKRSTLGSKLRLLKNPWNIHKMCFSVILMNSYVTLILISLPLNLVMLILGGFKFGPWLGHVWLFAPKNLGYGGDLSMILCCNMNACSVVGNHEVMGTLKPCIMQYNLCELCALTGSSDPKTLGVSPLCHLSCHACTWNTW